MEYGYKRAVNLTYEAALEIIVTALKEQGFGVLTRIDVKATMKEKLGVDFDKYIILGACNPPFAHKALEAEMDIGLMMPCNVVVYEHEGKTYVVATRPTVTMRSVDNPALAEFAPQVEAKLKAAIDSI